MRSAWADVDAVLATLQAGHVEYHSVHKVSAKIADKLLGSDTAQSVSDNSAPSTMVGTVVAQHAADLTEQEIAELARDAAKLAETGTRFTS